MSGARTLAAGKALVPVQVASGIARFALGYSHTGVQLTSGKVQCMGQANFGQLGVGDTDYDGIQFLTDVVGLDSGVTGLGMGLLHRCAHMQAGGMRCWGIHEQKQIVYIQSYSLNSY